MPKYMPLAEWKATVEAGTPPDDVLLHKSGLVDVKASKDPASREIDFIISTGSVDRERDVISQDGWQLANYKKSPVVLFAHDYRQPPIGRTTKIRVADGALKATVQFAPAEANPMAETVYQLVKGGYLGSASVGFRPMKHAFNAERGGVDFEKQELLEWSIVPVPANPEALMEGKAAGIDLAPLEGWAKGILDASEPPVEPTPKAPADCPMGAECPMRGKAHGEADHEMGVRLDRIELALVKLIPAPKAEPESVLPAPDDAIVFRLADDEPDEPDDRITIDPDAVLAAIHDALASRITHEVTAAVNALRGRVD